MKKKAQSLLDFINVLPLQSLQIIPRSPVSDKEVKALYEIWNSERDEYGCHILSEKTDPMTVASLTTKGMIQNKQISRMGFNGLPTRAVEITNKGRDIIRNIILANEKSAFEPDNDFDFKYEFIHRTADKTRTKTASRKERCHDNWLSRAMRWN